MPGGPPPLTPPLRVTRQQIQHFGIGITTADVVGSDSDDLRPSDYRKDFEIDSLGDEENILKMRHSAFQGEDRRCRTQEELDRLTKNGQSNVKDFMADFETDQEYYEDDYDYGEGLGHRVRSTGSLLDSPPYSPDDLRREEGSDSIMEFADEIKSDRSLREKELDYEDHSLRVDFDYRDEISDYESEIPPPSASIVRSSTTFDRLSVVDPYDRSVGRFGSRNRLSQAAPEPCRRVLSSDAVWLASSPVHQKKYKSNDEMMKRRHVVRFK